MTVVDGIMLVVILAIVAGVFAFMRKVLSRKKTRKVSENSLVELEERITLALNGLIEEWHAEGTLVTISVPIGSRTDVSVVRRSKDAKLVARVALNTDACWQDEAHIQSALIKARSDIAEALRPKLSLVKGKQTGS